MDVPKMKILLCILCFILLVEYYQGSAANKYVSGLLIDDTSWTCNDTCRKDKLNEDIRRMSREACAMMCDDPPLWPQPSKIKITKGSYSTFTKNQILFKFKANPYVKTLLRKASTIFMDNILNTDDPWLEEGSIDIFYIYVTVEEADVELNLETDESYSLLVKQENYNIVANITAQNYFGARHGLETLSQLIWKDTVKKQLHILDDVKIEDGPAFPYRGLMVDTARNFFSISNLKKVVQGMSASKLNVLHLHLTDSVSFPISLPSVAEMALTGSYGPDMTYTPEDIRELREYAFLRGVRLVLEVDAPGHVNQGWQFTKESLVICGENNIFAGHLNPDNKETLNVLQKIYGDLIRLSNQSELFHIGNDEVDTQCWKKTNAVKKFKGVQDFWVYYTNEMINRVKIANNGELPKNIIMWSSPLTDSYISNIDNKANVVVEFWFGRPEHFLNQGVKVIYATVGHWYLDCGFGPWRITQRNGVCDPYTGWKKFYRYRPWVEYGHKELALGGEACLWTEQVGEDNLETRIWPRAAAMAERLWSDPENDIDVKVASRFAIHRERLKSRGIKAAAIWPRYCTQNPHKCI